MKIAILVSSPVPPDIQEKVDVGLSPRPDYLALSKALNARLITPVRTLPKKRDALGRAHRFWRAAWAAFQRRDEYDMIISDLDRVGLILAALFKISGTQKQHILNCHGKGIHPTESWALKTFGLQTHIHRFVCYGRATANQLGQDLGPSASHVVHVRHPADHRFWRPVQAGPERLVVSGGAMLRDYRTLVEAVRGLDLRLDIAGFSPWVALQDERGLRVPSPDNVRFTRLDPPDLRRLYARSLFVAVPLLETDQQAGSLVVYEAMAMGKPVVVTGTKGMKQLGLITEGENGFYVPPGDVRAWRETITRLTNRPEETSRMGRQARAMVEQGLNLEQYVRDMVQIAVGLDPLQTSAAPVRPEPRRAADRTARPP